MKTSFPKYLYLHWPFCSKKCHYCDFVAFEQHEQFQDAYHTRLQQEVTSFANTFEPAEHKPLKTIFLGGGTPSLYPLDWITELFATIKTNYNTTSLQEVTLESNPADIDEEKLDVWREIGINRLSIGVQSLDDTVLLKLNRRQRNKDVKNALHQAPKYFDDISIDLILGLPGVSEKTWWETLHQVVDWPINHLSIYFLTIHEKTPLYFKVQKGNVRLADDTSLVELYQDSIQFLEKYNFKQYEISNFARPGRESIHNQAYWNLKPYKGFGIGASSYDGSTRSINTNNLQKYLTIDKSGASTTSQSVEILNPEQKRLERFMLGLRQKKGMGLHDMLYYLDVSQHKHFLSRVKLLQDQELLEERNGIIALTTRGMTLENEVLLQLL
ncbi:MAG: radical SAM family heme chaperone HemW [Epsilonproteobacteria bacterium]|nr:radical SAM family heme chaperone HemW [Campylobacterota bacterium]